MTKKERAGNVCRILNETYGEIPCYLDHETPWQLLFATIMSAQCTDARVNEVTKTLFVKYPDLKSFAECDVTELEKDIFSTGFYKNKAKNIKACAAILLEEYGGEVPSDIDELISLPGVGRKTANVIRGNIYGIQSVVVDTHVKRISRLLGLTEETEPEKIEFDLMKVLPKEHWILYNIQVIMLGRTVCVAGHPRCGECVLQDFCKHREKVLKQEKKR